MSLARALGIGSPAASGWTLEEIAFLGGVALLVGVVALGYRRWQRRRSEGLQRLCLERGWQYTSRNDALVTEWAPDFPLFEAGDPPRRCTDIVVVQRGKLTVTFADYSHREADVDAEGRHTTSTKRHAVAVAALPAALPAVRLAGENVLSRLGRTIGLRDIEIGVEAFDRRFRIKGDEATARSLLQPATVQLLLAQPYDTWELSGSRLLVTRPGRWQVEDYTTVAGLVEQFTAAVPRHLWGTNHGTG
jgi:hypothetical protein